MSAPTAAERPGQDLAATLVSLSEGLVSLSASLARALEAGNLDAAERLIADRGRLLDRMAVAATRRPAPAPAGLAAAAAQVADSDRRSRQSLSGRIRSIRDELAGLAAGMTALRAYGAPEALAPGFVDRRD